ncbi:excalibur calcium-binding domain-containing protein [Metaplanococcus flavidus]
MKKSLAGILTGSLLFIGTTFSVAADEHNDKDCGDFADHNEVMAFWYENGYSADNDPHRLDADNDGLACEVTQSEYDNYVASQEGDDSSESVTEEDQDESASESESEEGAALPDTASNGPLMMLFGAGVAGAGSLLLFRRKNKTA